MKIIFGLGNPGKEYEKTRHNIGFLMLDRIRQFHVLPDFRPEEKFKSEISSGSIGQNKVLLVKPQTFMNKSGEAVRSLIDFYKLSAADILIIHDDVDIELGKYKLATDSSSAGHNGVQNIFDVLGTQKITRLRIGIGKTPEEKSACRVETHDFVLGKFSESEQKTLEEIEGRLLEEAEKILT